MSDAVRTDNRGLAIGFPMCPTPRAGAWSLGVDQVMFLRGGPVKISYAAVLTVAALALQCAPSHAQGWRYYGNRSGESVGFADGLSQAPGGGLSQGPGGGLSVGPGGGLSQGMGGGLSVGPGGGLSVGMGGGLSQGPGGGLSQGPGGGLSVAMLGGLAVAPCGGLAVAPCGLPGPQRLNYLVFFDWDRFTLTRPARDLIAAAAKAIVEGRPYELTTLRREVRDLRRANEILKAASVFFARELDQPRPR